MDIAEFLAARLDEDEQVANAVVAELRRRFGPTDPMSATWNAPGEPFGIDVDLFQYDGRSKAQGQHIARHDPARVLADVAAKRRIIAEHQPRDPIQPDECVTCDSNALAWERQRAEWPCRTLLALARPYADHPDFDPAWRIEATREHRIVGPWISTSPDR